MTSFLSRAATKLPSLLSSTTARPLSTRIGSQAEQQSAIELVRSYLIGVAPLAREDAGYKEQRNTTAKTIIGDDFLTANFKDLIQNIKKSKPDEKGNPTGQLANSLELNGQKTDRLLNLFELNREVGLQLAYKGSPPPKLLPGI